MGRLDDRIAIVTGAGRGIGAAVAKQLAAEGARVVVNDNGGELDGSGSDKGPANDVVSAIRDAGGDAVPSYENVADFNAAAEKGMDARMIGGFGHLAEQYGKLVGVYRAFGIVPPNSRR